MQHVFKIFSDSVNSTRCSVPELKLLNDLLWSEVNLLSRRQRGTCWSHVTRLWIHVGPQPLPSTDQTPERTWTLWEPASCLSFCELRDSRGTMDCGKLHRPSNTSKNFSDDTHTHTHTHSVPAVFSLLTPPVLVTVVEAPSRSFFTPPPPLSVNRHRSRCAYCKVIVDDSGKLNKIQKQSDVITCTNESSINR